MLWFAVLFLVSLLPAIINGFPFYQNDSGDYSGANEIASGFRSIMPGLIAKPLFPLLGPWSLPIFNAAFVSFVIVRFSALALPNVPKWTVVLVACAAGTPFFASSIMPDMWISIAYLTLLLLLLRFSWIDFTLCLIAVMGHGLNPYILISTLILALVFLGESRWRAARLIVGILVCAILLEAGISYLSRGNPFPADSVRRLWHQRSSMTFPKLMIVFAVSHPIKKSACSKTRLMPADRYRSTSSINISGMPESGHPTGRRLKR